MYMAYGYECGTIITFLKTGCLRVRHKGYGRGGGGGGGGGAYSVKGQASE